MHRVGLPHVFAFLLAITVIGNVLSLHAQQTRHCPVTLPPIPVFIPLAPYPPVPLDSTEFWYGTTALWTRLPLDGTWNGLPRNEQGYRQKLFWWRPGYSGRTEQRPALIVTAHRLDDETLSFRAKTAPNAFFDGTWQMLVGVDFPTVGCWEVTGRYRESAVTFVVLVGRARSTGQASPRRMLPFYDWDACPFEGCVYREWTARKSVHVFDTWKARRHEIARLVAGQKVTGITGVVITLKPGTIRMDRDLPDKGLERGDTILTYTYRGEGFSAVWFKGQFEPEFDISFAKWPDGFGCGGAHCAATYMDLGRKVWWAQIKLASGRTGWVEMVNDAFSGIDVLADR